MNHRIEKMKHKWEFIEGNVKTSLNGYAFIDECGRCIIIVYGEGRRDSMAEYLKSDKDPLGMKYKCIDLLP